MSKTLSALITLAGFLLVFGGVGGIENSENNTQLISSTVVCVIGLMTCFAAGYLSDRNGGFYDSH